MVVLLGAAQTHGYCSNDDVAVVLRAVEDRVGEPLVRGLGSNGGGSSSRGEGRGNGEGYELQDLCPATTNVVIVWRLRMLVSFTNMTKFADTGKLGQGARE